MGEKDLTQAGEKVVAGLRDNLLKPMHNSLFSQMQSHHEEVMHAVTEELPQTIIAALADAFRTIRWDDNEPK